MQPIRGFVAVLVSWVFLTSWASELRRIYLSDGPTPSCTVNLGGEFPGAQGSLRICQDPSGGADFARLAFDLTRGAYVGFQHSTLLPEGSSVLTFEARSSVPGMRLFVRTKDRKLETHLRMVPIVLKSDEWTTVTCDLRTFGDYWGGPREGKIHWPITEIVLGTHFQRAKYPRGSVDVRNVVIRTTASPQEFPHYALRPVSPRFGALYYPGETPVIRYRLLSQLVGASPRFKVTQSLYDWQGRLLHREAAAATDGVFSYRLTDEKRQGLLGAFEVRVEAEEMGRPGTSIRRSTWFGCLSSRNPRPSPWIGTQLHSWNSWGGGEFRLLDILSSVGYGVVRDSLSWRAVEQRRGQYSLTPVLLSFFKQLKARGIRLNCMLVSPNKLYTNPLDPVAFGKFATYAAHELKGLVDTFEIWNEPHNFSFRKHYGGPLHGDDATWLFRFVEFTKSTCAAIRRSQPEAVIGVTSEDYLPTLKQMIRLGISDAGNLITIHPYCHGQPRPEREFFLDDNGKSLRGLSAAHGGTKKFAITEAGWTTYSGKMDYLSIAGGYPRSSYVHQAQYIVRMYLNAIAAGADYAIQYDFRDDGPNRSYTEHNFGVVHEDFTPKPSLLAVAQLCRQLEDARYEGNLSPNHRTRMHWFSRGGKPPLVVAYAVEGEERFRLPLGGEIQILDLQGNSVTPGIEGGALDLVLTERPVYITGLDLARMNSRLELDARVTGHVLIPGESHELQVWGRNLTGHNLDTIRGAVLLQVAGKTLQRIRFEKENEGVQAGARFKTSIKVVPEQGIWKRFLGSSRPVTAVVSLEEHGRTHSCSVSLGISAPVECRVWTLARHHGRASVPFLLTNRTARALRVTVRGTSPQLSGLSTGSMLLGPGATSVLHLQSTVEDLPDSAEVRYAVATPDGAEYAGTCTVRSSLVPLSPQKRPLAAQGIFIDSGSLLSSQPSPADLQAFPSLSYTAEGLVFEVDVHDDHFFQPFSNHDNPWNGDSVQLALASVVRPNDFLELTVARFPDGGKVTVSHKIVADTSPEEFKVAVTDVPEGLRYRVIVPWRVIPGCRKLFRFSCLVNDNDGGGRKGWLEFHSGIGAKKEPGLFGTYCLDDR